jgi:hypothetical protein
MSRRVVVLLLGLLVTSCGPEAFNMSHCVTVAQYDGADFFPECSPRSFCGDGYCDQSLETYVSCPGDCSTPLCGDGVCEEGEDLSCPDCEALPVCCCCGTSCSTTQIASCDCTISPASACDPY